MSRIWPKRYLSLENSFQSFRFVLQDFLDTFHEHSEAYGKEMLATRKFYQISEWNPEKYERLNKLHDFHVDLVQDLIVELTRALNYICDNVRDSIFPTFRIKEGVNLIETGPNMDLGYKILRVEYRGEERTATPYPGLKEFKQIREKRDWCFGIGMEPEV